MKVYHYKRIMLKTFDALIDKVSETNSRLLEAESRLSLLQAKQGMDGITAKTEIAVDQAEKDLQEKGPDQMMQLHVPNLKSLSTDTAKSLVVSVVGPLSVVGQSLNGAQPLNGAQSQNGAQPVVGPKTLVGAQQYAQVEQAAEIVHAVQKAVDTPTPVVKQRRKTIKKEADVVL